MSIVLAGDLSIHEAQKLVGLLSQSGIDSLFKEEGYGNMRRIKSGSNFEDRHLILIDEKDEIIALEILNRFRLEMEAEHKIRAVTCPKCGKSGSNVQIKSLDLIQKLIYIGTTPKSCISCGEQWFD